MPSQHAAMTIRHLDPALKERLRIRAAQRGHSMETEARYILQTALSSEPAPPSRHLYDRVRARLAPLGGADLDLPPREPARDPPRLDAVIASPCEAIQGRRAVPPA